MEEVTNTIFIANKRWYTLKRRNDAQKGLLNDVKYIIIINYLCIVHQKKMNSNVYFKRI